MANTPTGDELIDVVVRLPRATVEESIQAARQMEQRTQSGRTTLAKALLASLRRRPERFIGIHFSDPSWDMMLEVYVAATEGRQFRVSKLCALVSPSTSTAFRHLESLEDRGFLRRTHDPGDGRSTLVVMQPALQETMEQWLDHLAVDMT